MTAKIIEIIDEAQDIRSFKLQAKMEYLPGQWFYVKLDENLKHHFTISSSPTEDFLQFTTKFREESDYKKALWQKKVGDELEINGPFGGFTLDEKDATPRLFIAGGIGITPFRSMIKYISDKQVTLPLALLYSVKNKNEGAFVKYLDELRIKNYELRTIETEKEGRLDKEKIEKHCPDWKERTWWICGPPAMVEAAMMFAPTGARSEEFTGY